MAENDIEALAVEQCDREAAAQVYDARPSDWSGASDQVRRGLHDDTAIVQAFARHRLTALRSTTAEPNPAVAADGEEHDRGPNVISALQAIANLPTGRNEDVMEGHEQAYRAVEALFTTPPHIEAHPTDSAAKDADIAAYRDALEKAVSRDEAVKWCEHALRNVQNLELEWDDIADIAEALTHFRRAALANRGEAGALAKERAE